ncbi:MAG: hypothetical protein ACK5C8_08055, partial [Roseiflexaceae bacterium]
MRRIAYFYVISLIIALLCIISVRSIQRITTTPNTVNLTRIWERTALSGSYSFETEIEQVNVLEPRMSNVGIPARRQHYRMSGMIDESQQTSHILIENLAQETAAYEIRQERGLIYTRRTGQAWQQTSSVQFAENARLRSVSFLLGIVHTTPIASADAYEFTFSGARYLEGLKQFIRTGTQSPATSTLLTQIAQQEQMQRANGSGTVTLTADGLPETLQMEISLPANAKDVAQVLHVKSTFSDYARTGLALKMIIDQPLMIIAEHLNVNLNQIMYGLFIFGILWVLVAISWTCITLGVRIHVPTVILVIGMILFQPYSTLPRSHAQTVSTPDVPAADQSGTIHAGSITIDLADTSGFNPFVSPLTQPILKPGTSFQSANQLSTGMQRTTTSSSSTTSNSTTIDTDSDSDGLTDDAETQIGTDPLSVDSDFDQISDLVEVTVPSQYGSMALYTNPLKNDTNNDGFADSIECPQHVVISTNTPIQSCTDSDGDLTPDFLDIDNDNDGVPDNKDENVIGSRGSNSQPLSQTNPFTYQLKLHKDTTINNYIEVSMQFRLADSTAMYSHQAVYDWPNNDTLGQVQRTNNTTYKDIPNSGGLNDNFNRGDMSLNGTVLIEVPITNGDWGNLPITPTCRSNPATTNCAKGERVPAWLDEEVLRKNAISANYAYRNDGSVDKSIIQLTAAIQPVYDDLDTLVAYKTNFIYQVNNPSLVPSSNTIRPTWAITGIVSRCPDNLSTCNASERVDSIAPLHSYAPDWVLTGMTATEHIGTTFAYIVEDATKTSVSAANVRRKEIMRLHQLLEGAFIDTHWLNIDDANPTRSIVKLFANGSWTAEAAEKYGIAKDAFRVSTNTYDTRADITSAPINQENPLTNLPIVGGKQKFSKYAAGCVTQPMTVSCTPAMITLTETRTRSTQFYDSKSTSNALSLEQSTVTVDRSMVGEIFKPVYDAQNPTLVAWDGVELEVYDAEADLIRPYITPDNKGLFDNKELFKDISVQSWNELRNQTFVSGISNFLVTTSSTESSTDDSINQMSKFESTRATTWQEQLTQFMKGNSALFITFSQRMANYTCADVSQESVYSQIVELAMKNPDQRYGTKELINIGTTVFSCRYIVPEMQYPGLHIKQQISTTMNGTEFTIVKGIVKSGLMGLAIKDFYEYRKLY